MQPLMPEAEQGSDGVPLGLLPVPNPGLVYPMPIAHPKASVVLMLIFLTSILVELICFHRNVRLLKVKS